MLCECFCSVRWIDCFVLCIVFCRKAREDEMEASRRLSEMIANYGDVIPRRDYEQLQTQYEVQWASCEIDCIHYHCNNCFEETIS